jgi:hypothetical protein
MDSISCRDAYLFACILCELNTGTAFGQDQRLYNLSQLYLSLEWRRHRAQVVEYWRLNGGPSPFTKEEDQLLLGMLSGNDTHSCAYSLLHALGAIMYRSPLALDRRWQHLQPNATPSMEVSLKRDLDRWRRAMMEIDEPIRLGTGPFNRDSQLLFESVRGLMEGSLKDLERVGVEEDARFQPLWLPHQQQLLQDGKLEGEENGNVRLQGLRVAENARLALPDIKVIEQNRFYIDAIKPDPNTVYGCQCNGDCTRNPDNCSCLSDNYMNPKGLLVS